MAQLFGTFIDCFPEQHDSLELRFTPSSHPIQKRWRNNRLSANFIAEYLSSFIPVEEDEPIHEHRIRQAKGIVAYIANELLENAMKFNHQVVDFKINFCVSFVVETDVTVAISVTNSISSVNRDKLVLFIDQLLSTDPADLYVAQVEKSAEEGGEASGLGLLTIVNDYSAQLGWRLETGVDNPEITLVTTMAQILV
jgi:hypothetical protein